LISEQKFARRAIDYECHKYRMTYERAGYIFRAMKLENIGQSTRLEFPSTIPFGILWDASDMGLVLPDNGKFESFVDLNEDRLQLFDDDPIAQALYLRFDQEYGELINYTVCFYSNDIF
jgi:hypothetical protein